MTRWRSEWEVDVDSVHLLKIRARVEFGLTTSYWRWRRGAHSRASGRSAGRSLRSSRDGGGGVEAAERSNNPETVREKYEVKQTGREEAFNPSSC